ncbi:unnamed protein product [Schistocephalus solidus]|uniref:Peptidase A2 domain-containing protein n=1 Tax=Schistocephalus solidus TaxID=70667 RepID=A0A183T044_SCHSO|nr:unnamed protein product [Schistocephalus solidus]
MAVEALNHSVGSWMLSRHPNQRQWVKWVSPRVNATNITGVSSPGRTFYICETQVSRRFLVDTGAQLSVTPHTATGRRCPNPGLFPRAVNTSPISTFSTRSLSLDIGLQLVFSSVFVVADIPCPRPSVSESYIEKDLATCARFYLQCDRVGRPLLPHNDNPFWFVSRGTKTFRIQRGTREEGMSVDRLKAAVPNTPCGPLPSVPPPPHPLSSRPAYFI